MLTSRSHEVAALEKDHDWKDHGLYLCPILPFLALAFQDKAFKDYETPEQLFALRSIPKQKARRIEFKDSVKDKPVFRQCTSQQPNKIDDTRGLEYSSIRNVVIELSMVAGYLTPPKFYGFRRNMANRLNCERVDDDTRNLIMAHTSQVFRINYASGFSVDAQAIARGQPQRIALLDQLRQSAIVRDERAPVSLLDKKLKELYDEDDELASIRKQLEDVERSSPEYKRLQVAQANRKIVVTDKGLQQYRKEWFSEILHTEEGCERDKSVHEFSRDLESYMDATACEIQKSIAAALFKIPKEEGIFDKSDSVRLSILKDTSC